MRALIAGAIALSALSATTGCSSSFNAASSSLRWDAPIEIATGGGQRGEWRQNDSDYNYVDDPSVAFDRTGNTAVVWVDQATKDVYFRTFTRAGLPAQAPVNVSRSPAVFSWLPRLAIHGDDVYVLWQEIVFSGGTHGGEAFFARSLDGGVTFEEPQNLSESTNGDGKGRINAKVWHNGSLDLAVARDGTLITAWTEYDGPLWVSRSSDRGGSFDKPLRVDGGSKPARAPALAVAGDGTIFLAWTVGEDDGADLRLAVSRDGGKSFSAERVIAKTPGYSDAPKLAVDSAGTLHLVWAESAGGPFDQFDVRYMRSRNQGHTFEVARPLSPVSSSASFPSLAIDGRGVYVLWERSRGLALAYSLDGGTTFGAAIDVEHSADPNGGANGSHQGKLMRKLAVASGRIAVVNSALAHGRGSRVWLVHGERR